MRTSSLAPAEPVAGWGAVIMSASTTYVKDWDELGSAVSMSRSSVAILKYNKQRSMSKDNTPFRVLAIDGGGARGIFPAHILSLIGQELERDLGSVFDLTVGTS